MSFSLSVAWAIDTAQVTARPRFLAARITSSDSRAGDLRGVVAPTRQRGEANIALDNDDFGFLRDAGEAEARGDFALVHHAGADEVWVGGVVHDERAEIAGIGKRAAHDGGVGDRVTPVGEANRAGVLQQAELGHLAGRRDPWSAPPCG